MKIASSTTTGVTIKDILVSYQNLTTTLGGHPDLLFLSCTVNYDLQEFFKILEKEAPDIQITGCTSCKRVVTDMGMSSEETGALSMFGILDPEGCYGVAGAAMEEDVAKSARSALEAALKNSKCIGEVPSHIWMHSSPGQEEILIEEIEKVVGRNIPISGGSSADNDLTGQWKIFANGETLVEGVVITVLYPSTETFTTFHSGYSPTKIHGIITRTASLDSISNQQRLLQEIDHRPAAEVYNEWTNGEISDHLESGGVILQESSMHPLGLVSGYIGEIPYYQLSHPETVTTEKAITMFSKVTEGESITLMQGSSDSLVSRAGRVIHSLRDTHTLAPDDIAGALVIYCAGCMLTIEDRLDEVEKNIKEALPGVPFMGSFTFGEQGSFLNGTNRHGNLMISVLLITRS